MRNQATQTKQNRPMQPKRNQFVRILHLTLSGWLVCTGLLAKPITFSNVSYDPTRELYEDVQSGLLPPTGRQKTGDDRYRSSQSHGGSGKQSARGYRRASRPTS